MPAARSGRLVLAICLIVGFSLTVGASLTFMVTPMLADLGLTSEQAAVALALPSIGSLLIVFAAGRIGDARGQRTVIAWVALPFTVGAILVAMAPSMPWVSIGLILAGAAATAIQVTALGLLQAQFPGGPERVRAFTSFGMVFPAVYLVVPVLTGWTVDAITWRVVPAAWAAFGIAIGVLAIRALPSPIIRTTTGELLTPLAAGLALAATVQFVNRGHDDGWASPTTLILLVIAALAATTAGLSYRRSRTPSLDLGLLRQSTTLPLLVAVALVVMVNVITYVMLGLQYLFGLSVLQSAVALLPAQAAAILGAKVLAAQLMSRLGAHRAGPIALVGLAVSLLSMITIRTSSGAWLLVLCAAAFSLFGFAAITILNADVMAQATADNTGQMSAFRGAASSLGGALSIVILGAAVGEAVQRAAGGSVSDVEPEAVAAGLRANGLVGAAVALIALAVLIAAQRARRPAMPRN